MWGRDVHTGFWWGKPEGKRAPEKPRHGDDDNIKRESQEIVWDELDLGR
jgi:hypothetical protein